MLGLTEGRDKPTLRTEIYDFSLSTPNSLIFQAFEGHLPETVNL